METVVTFEDYYDNEVTLSFDDHPFSQHPKHVWVICRFLDQWLLTRHPRRGWEFPGGKVEAGESPRDAAIREVDEETGGHVDRIDYVGQYKVLGKSGTIIKNVYYAIVNQINARENYHETQGPLLIEQLPAHIKQSERYSFMMKDDVLTYSLAQIRDHHIEKASPTD